MVKVENVEENVSKLTITVPADQWANALDESFKKAQAKVEVKGFRKGHCPRGVFEREYGVEALYEEAINYAINHSYDSALVESKLEAVSQPEIDFDISKVAKDKDFVYTAKVTTKPEVKLGDYKGLEVEKLSTEVLDSEVEEAVESMLSKKAYLAPKENATALENGDISVIDFEGFIDDKAFPGGKGENFELEIGSKQFVPGFEEKMIGMKPGETKDIIVTFPDDYQAKDLAGKEAKFIVTLHEIKVRITPELNDEVAKELDDKCETVADLKAKVKKDLAEKKQADSENNVIDKLVDMAVKNATLTVPGVMVSQEQEDMIEDLRRRIKDSYNMELDMFLQFQGMDLKKYKESLEPQALKSVQTRLVLEAIAAVENIKPTEEKIEETYDELAKAYNMTLEEVKKRLPKEYLEIQLMPQVTIDFLKENAKIN